MEETLRRAPVFPDYMLQEFLKISVAVPYTSLLDEITAQVPE